MAPAVRCDTEAIATTRMTRNAIARIAGGATLLYIIIGIAGLALVRPGSAGAALAQAGQSASALTLAVTLYLVTSPA